MSPIVDTKVHEAQILAELAKLGGGTLSDDGIVHEGTRLVIPDTMSKKDAVKAMLRNIEAEEEEVSFTTVLTARPWDVAAAFERTVRRHFGMMTQVATTGMFGQKNPPEMRTINVDVNQQIQVPWGRIELPAFPGAKIDLFGAHDNEHGIVGGLQFLGPRRWKAHAQGLFELVRREVKDNSIYKGKAFDGAEMPNFIDLSGVTFEDVIYSDDIIAQLDANVWSLLNYSQAQREAGLPLKRAVLLEGPYGTGKTLGAYLTAKVARENGWTFIYCRPGKDDIHQTLQTARLYQPAVVFFEDVDEISDSGDGVTRLLDTFDGMTSKGTELMVILTTNHAEKIHKGMLRPGRLDAVLHIGELDANGVYRMIKRNVPANLLGQVDVTEVFSHMEGFMPAFVKEAIDRAKRYNMARHSGKLTKLETADFVEAAKGLRPQLDLMNGNKAHEKKDRLTELVRNVVFEGATEALQAN